MFSDIAYQSMDEDAYDLLTTYADSKELISMTKFQGEDGRIDVCKGLRDWAAEEREAGIVEGIERGIAINLTENIRNLIKNLGLTLEEALEALMVPKEEWDRYQKTYSDV